MPRRLSILMLLIALALCAVTGTAGAAMYWGNGWTVGVAEPDGTKVTQALPAGGSSVLRTHGPICGIAISPTHLYWNEWGTITRLDLNGGAPQALTGGLGCAGLAVDDQFVYWANRGGGIARANLDGSATNPKFIDGLAEPCGVAVAGGYVYWTNSYGSPVGRARLDGGGVERELIEESESAGCGIAIAGPYLYWAGSRGIGRAELDGSGAVPSFIPGYSRVSGIAVWGPYIYWTEEGHPGTIGRANLDGSAPNREFVITGTHVNGIAFDARPVPTRTSPSIEVRKVEHARGKGFAYVTVAVPGHGELGFRAKGAGWRLLSDNRPSWRAGPFEVKLKLWPGRVGREGKRVRKQLRRDGRARVFLRLTYTEAGSLPTTTKKLVHLIRKPNG